MSGADLNAARAALDEGQGRPSRLFWTPLSLAILYRGRVDTWHLGPRPAGMPSLLPSRFWPRSVVTTVVSALADALLRDLPDGDDELGGGAEVPA